MNPRLQEVLRAGLATGAAGFTGDPATSALEARIKQLEEALQARNRELSEALADASKAVVRAGECATKRAQLQERYDQLSERMHDLEQENEDLSELVDSLTRRCALAEQPYTDYVPPEVPEPYDKPYSPFNPERVAGERRALAARKKRESAAIIDDLMKQPWIHAAYV